MASGLRVLRRFAQILSGPVARGPVSPQTAPLESPGVGRRRAGPSPPLRCPALSGRRSASLDPVAGAAFDAIGVALTGPQILASNLPLAPAKKTDGTSAAWKGVPCQLEALPPDLLAGIVDEAIRDQLDLDLVAEQIEAEERDRIELTRALPSGEGGR